MQEAEEMVRSLIESADNGAVAAAQVRGAYLAVVHLRARTQKLQSGQTVHPHWECASCSAYGSNQFLSFQLASTADPRHSVSALVLLGAAGHLEPKRLLALHGS
jgi:hypothetical protein